MKKPISLIVVFILVLQVTQLLAATDKYRLTLRDNPTTTIVIGWNQVSGNNPVLFYGTEDNGVAYEKYPMNTKPSREVDYAEMKNKFVRLTGLTPNTSYYFVIKDSEGVSKRFWFKTAPNGPDARYSFIAGGDSRSNAAPRRNANLLVSKLKPHAILFGGDMMGSGSPEQWKEWLDDWQLTISDDGRMYPIVAVRGNHEKNNEMVEKLFDSPSKDIYYALTIGDNMIRTYVLNTEIPMAGAQTEWLKTDLEKNKDMTWKIGIYHEPMRPHVGRKDEGNEQYTEWAQLFYDNKVKLVVESDAHTVKTTWPIRPSTKKKSDEGFIRDDKRGTVYVGEGSWGAPVRDSNDPKSWTRACGAFNQFKWFFIDKDKIELRTVKYDNAQEVESVPNDDPFVMPDDISLWYPATGSVLEITH